MRPTPVALVLLAAAACGPMISDVRDDSVPIVANSTFAWGNADGLKERTERDPRVDNDSVKARIERAIEAEFVRRGFRKVAATDADLLLHYHVGVLNRADTLLGPTSCAGAPCNVPKYAWGYWGEPEWGPREVRYVEGRLMLDVVDRPSLKLAWRGQAEGSVTDESATEKRINWIVALVMERFPVQP